MSVMSSFIGRIRRIRKRTIIVSLILAIVIIVTAVGIGWIIQRYFPTTEPELTQAEYEERAKQYLGERTTPNGAFVTIDRKNSTIEIETAEGKQSYKYDAQTVFARGITYDKIEPSSLEAGQEISLTVVKDEYVEVVWLPE